MTESRYVVATRGDQTAVSASDAVKAFDPQITILGDHNPNRILVSTTAENAQRMKTALGDAYVVEEAEPRFRPASGRRASPPLTPA